MMKLTIINKDRKCPECKHYTLDKVVTEGLFTAEVPGERICRTCRAEFKIDGFERFRQWR